MTDQQLEILESPDETSVYRGDELLATFYGTRMDPNGHGNARFFASRYSQAHDIPAATDPVAGAVLAAHALTTNPSRAPATQLPLLE